MTEITHKKILDSLCILSGLSVIALVALRIFVVFPLFVFAIPLPAPSFYLLGLLTYAWFKKT